MFSATIPGIRADAFHVGVTGRLAEGDGAECMVGNMSVRNPCLPTATKDLDGLDLI